MGEALEALHEAGVIDGPARLAASFDDYKLILTLNYPGRPIHLAAAGPANWQALLEAEGEDAALDEAMAAMSGVLIPRYN